MAAEMEDEYCALPFNHDAEYAVGTSFVTMSITPLFMGCRNNLPRRNLKAVPSFKVSLGITDMKI